MYVVLRIETSASHILGKHSISEPQPQPMNVILFGNRVFADLGYNKLIRAEP